MPTINKESLRNLELRAATSSRQEYGGRINVKQLSLDALLSQYLVSRYPMGTEPIDRERFLLLSTCRKVPVEHMQMLK